MKHREFVRHLLRHGCRLTRQGASHEIWLNTINGKFQPIPRHTEISARLIRGICRKLDVEPPSEK